MSDVEPTTGDDLSSERRAVAKRQVSEHRPPWPSWMISVLIAAHVLVGIALALYSNRQSNVSYFLNSLILCQCSLVGLWGAMGRVQPTVRIVGMLAAAVYLGTELWWQEGFRSGFGLFVLVLLASLPVAAITWTVRYRMASRIDEPGVARNGIQFSIRSLILLTIVIACLLTLGRMLAPYLRENFLIAAILVTGICSVFVALTSIWAMLGRANPFIRCFLVIPMSATAGWIGGSVLGESFLDIILILMIYMLLQAFFLLVSLFVVRRCGYRLAEKVPVAIADAENARSQP